MLKSKSAYVNGREFVCVEFPGTKALSVYYAVLKAVGPTLGSVAGPGASPVLDKDVDFGRVIRQFLLDNPNAEAVQNLIYMLVGSVSVNGSPLSARSTFDEVFAGAGMLDLVEILKLVLETNFGDFSALAARFTSDAAVVASPTPESAKSSPVN